MTKVPQEMQQLPLFTEQRLPLQSISGCSSHSCVCVLFVLRSDVWFFSEI